MKIQPSDPLISAAYKFTIDVYYSDSDPLLVKKVQDASGNDIVFTYHSGCTQVSDLTGTPIPYRIIPG